MDRFISQYLLKLDAKGRVSVPAPFRAILGREGFDGILCCPAVGSAALDAGGATLLDEIEALVASYPPLSDEREQVATALYGTSEILKMDAEGRVSLSDALKDHAGILDAAAFIGLGHKFQIWAPDRLGAQLAGATATMRKLRQAGGQRAAVKPQGARER